MAMGFVMNVKKLKLLCMNTIILEIIGLDNFVVNNVLNHIDYGLLKEYLQVKERN